MTLNDMLKGFQPLKAQLYIPQSIEGETDW